LQLVVDGGHATGGLKRCDQGVMSLPRIRETLYDSISVTDSDRDILQAGGGKALGPQVTGNIVRQSQIILTGGLDL